MGCEGNFAGSFEKKMVPTFCKEILSWTAPSTGYFYAPMRSCRLWQNSDHAEEQKEKTSAFYDIVEMLS